MTVFDRLYGAYRALRGDLAEEKLEEPTGLKVRSAAAELRRGIGDDDDPFKRRQSKTTEEGTSNPLLWYGGLYADSYLDWLNQSTIRYDRYARYEEMDRNLPEITTALNMYADYAVAGSMVDKDEVFKVKVEDPEQQEILEAMLRRTGLPDYAWQTVREMCKFGDSFWELIVTPMGLSKIGYRPPASMEKQFDNSGDVLGYKQYGIPPAISKDQESAAEFDRWQVCHFMLQLSAGQVYGTSILRSVDRLAKILELLFDGMVINRLANSQPRYKWKVDVADMNPVDRLIYLMKFRRETKRTRYTDASGKMEMRTNPLRSDEDIYIPVSDKSKNDVERMQGDPNISKIGDMDMIYDRLFMGLGMYRGWFSSNGNATLSGDTAPTIAIMNFLRAIRRVRKDYAHGIVRCCRVELRCQGYSKSVVDDVVVRTTFPSLSQIDDLTAMKVDQLRYTIVALGQEAKLLTREQLLIRHLGFSEKEAKAQVALLKKEAAESQAEAMAAMQATGGQAADAAKPEDGQPIVKRPTPRGAPPIPVNDRTRIESLNRQVNELVECIQELIQFNRPLDTRIGDV